MESLLDSFEKQFAKFMKMPVNHADRAKEFDAVQSMFTAVKKEVEMCHLKTLVTSALSPKALEVWHFWFSGEYDWKTYLGEDRKSVEIRIGKTETKLDEAYEGDVSHYFMIDPVQIFIMKALDTKKMDSQLEELMVHGEHQKASRIVFFLVACLAYPLLLKEDK